jgi:hypothetical protein
VEDAKEQVVRLAPAAHLADVPRIVAYVRGWASSLATLEDPLGYLPQDLVLHELLDDPELVTERAFAAAAAEEERRDALFCAREDADLLRLLERHLGTGDPRIAPLLALARPAIEIFSEEVALGDVPLGGSRLGGHPDLPPDLDWPCEGDQPLSFLAQLDLAEVRASAGDAAGCLPDRGWLAFFFLLEGDCREAGRGGARVLSFDVPRDTLVRHAPPERRRPPAGLPSVGTLPSRSPSFHVRRHAFPQLDSPFYTLLTGRPFEREAEWRAVETEAVETYAFLAPYAHDGFPPDARDARDRLLGYADVCQSDPYQACAMRAESIPNDRWYARTTRERAAESMLLFQADSSSGAGVSYGDAGIVHFLVRPEDLAARRFDRVEGELQCH